ncbi:MAG TPA: DMT family transporter [Thermoanaerobaculia bacterium]|jgi:drug/metabolite transporter (DMT)-like permease
METSSAVAAVRPVSRAVPVSKALFAVVVWGASFIATKIALPEVQPVTVVWLRFAMGVAVMGMIVALRRQLFVPKASDLAYFTGLGFLGITFHQWLQSNGLVTAQAGTTAWIVASTPIFMALLGWLVLRERLGWLGAAGIAVAALGVLLVVSRGDFSAVSAGRFGTPGDFLILLSAPNWAVFSVLSRKGLQRHSSAGMMFWVMATGWLLTTILFLTGPGFGDVVGLSARGWSAVAFLGIACSGLAYVFWYDALRVLPASQVGAFLYLEPLVAVAVAAVLLGEPLLLATLAGGVAILLGVWLVGRRPAVRG